MQLSSKYFAKLALLIMMLATSPSLAAKVAVRFVVHCPADTPADSTIYLAGSAPQLGTWRPDGLKLARQADGTFAGEAPFEVGQTIEFKVTRGAWATVEKNADGTEHTNRTAKITADTRQIESTVERWANGTPASTLKSTVVGTLKIHDIDSHALKQSRKIRVWLPPSYDTDKDARYDVLYMHDGQNCFDRATSAFGNEWEIDESLTRLIAEKKIPPIIVVAIDNGLANRINELTYAADAKLGGGQAADYTDFLLSEVMPFVERTYPTNTGPAHTYLGGSSLGGLASFEIARRHPGTFGGVIAMSPALFWADEALTRDIERDPGGLRNTRVWLDMGSMEGGIINQAQTPGEAKSAASDAAGQPDNSNSRLVTAAHRLDEALSKHNIRHRLTIDADHPHHNEPAWAARFPQAAEYLFHP